LEWKRKTRYVQKGLYVADTRSKWKRRPRSWRKELKVDEKARSGRERHEAEDKNYVELK